NSNDEHILSVAFPAMQRLCASQPYESSSGLNQPAEPPTEEPEEASSPCSGGGEQRLLPTAASPAPSSEAPFSPSESRSPSPGRSTVSPAVSTQGEDGASSRDSGGAGTSGASSSKSSNNPYAAGLKPRCNSEDLVHVDCHLENKDLWDKFHDLGTEMIITKSGR
ncbi:unnamed protein product, partial [Ixodes pacificus]